MPEVRPEVPPAVKTRWPRRTARFRLASLFGGLFLLSGAALVLVTFELFQRATRYRPPHLPAVPSASSLQSLLGLSPLAQAQQQLAQAQSQLLLQAPNPSLAPFPFQLGQVQERLASARQQLAEAVHQVAKAGSLQAAQRAADSHQLLVDSGIALAIVAGLALLAGWLAAGRILRPIRTMTRTARQISSSNLHERLALDGPQDELKQLGETLNDLFGRLETAFEAQRRFVASASHELRTPLTAERNLLQVALDDPRTDVDAWRTIAEEVPASNDEQAGLIEALLALASSEVERHHEERTDLAEICRTVLRRPTLDSGRLGLRIDAELRTAVLLGDPRLIELLVANLVENAVGHNVAGGWVHIRTRPEGTAAVLTVTNTGPVIRLGEVERLFQPFQRLDPGRTHHGRGHGLGLSIVRAIAGSHHATISSEARSEGGLSVTIGFPARGGQPSAASRQVDSAAEHSASLGAASG